MNKRPVVASPPWTPAEDEKLRALVALGERPATIAEQLQRSEEAVRHRFYKLGIPLKTIRIAGAKGEEKTFANHPERQFMEYLRGKGWVKETALPSSRLVVSLQKKGVVLSPEEVSRFLEAATLAADRPDQPWLPETRVPGERPLRKPITLG